MKVFNLAEELEKERKKNKELQNKLEDIDSLINSNCQLNECIDKLEQDNKELEELLKSANESITWWSNRYNALEKEIKQLTAESTEWEERTYCWQDRAEEINRLQEVINKINRTLESSLSNMQKLVAISILLKKEEILEDSDNNE